MHRSFHQLLQEQSQCVAEEGLELQPRGPGARAPTASGEPARPRPGCWAGAARAPGLLQAWDGGGGGVGEIAGQLCPRDLWTSLRALQKVTARPSWGPRVPWCTARPRSASWPACPVAPSVSGTLCPWPWRRPQAVGWARLSGGGGGGSVPLRARGGPARPVQPRWVLKTMPGSSGRRDKIGLAGPSAACGLLDSAVPGYEKGVRPLPPGAGPP